jgi:hypothetical protein
MTKEPEPTYTKYQVVGDASMLRRVFALVFDAALLLLLHIMISIPLWSLAPDYLAFPIDIAETEILDEQTTVDGDATITTQTVDITYFSLTQELDTCRFLVVVIEEGDGASSTTSRDKEPLEPCAYLERFDFGTWFMLALFLFYAPLMEGSRLHATVGKLALAIRLQKKDGREVTFARAFVRNLAEALCLATLSAGYLVALFTTRRQALHDLLAGTVVVER